ncbi:MAG: RHS repeat domain-containing protein, partial [Gammaproteobacteria bacterium]
TTYGYHPIGASPPLGAGRHASVDGPLSNDVIAYAYDELGRVRSRAINGVALTYEYDALGRIKTENNVLGAFSYQFDGVASRLETVTYPNGQTSSYAYFPSSGDHRLQEIHHRKLDGTTISKFNYTYDAVGNINTWTQQQDTSAAKAYDFEYDRAGQLRNAVWRTTDATPTILKRYGYTYDPAGNRTVEQLDNAPTLSAYDNMNHLTSQTPGGTIRFAGTLGEAATVTIQSQPAVVTSDNRFERAAQVSSGTNQVVVKAKDYAGNERTNTYEVSVSGSSKTFTFDANGNMTSDGIRTLEWDAENRLTAVIVGTQRSEFQYDGNENRVRIVEKTSGVVNQDLRFVWCDQICEERDGVDGASIKRRFFSWGMQEVGVNFYYARDHLSSIREIADSSSAIRARYDYDPFGRASKLSGDKDSPFQYTDHYYHPTSSLTLAQYRAYDSNLGRWLSADPVGFGDGPNDQIYVGNDPINRLDPQGLAACFSGMKLTGILECSTTFVSSSGFCGFSGAKGAVEKLCDELKKELKKKGEVELPASKCPDGQTCTNMQAVTEWRPVDETVIIQKKTCTATVKITGHFEGHGQLGVCQAPGGGGKCGGQ